MKTTGLVLVATAWILSGVPQARGAAAPGCAAGQALRLQADAPLLSGGALTQLNMSTLFTVAKEGSGQLVTVTVVNPASQARSFRLLFELKAIPTDRQRRESCLDPLPESGGQGCWIQRKMLVNTTLKPGEVWTRTSGMLEDESYQGKAINPEDSPFQKLLAREGAIPPGVIFLSVALLEPLEPGRGQENVRVVPTSELPLDTCAEAPVRRFMASYQPTRAAVLLTPGIPASEGFAPAATLTPTFVFAGNLDGLDLGGEQPYRLSLWKVREGEPLGEVVERRPLHTAMVRQSPVPWDAGWPALEPGKRYVWRLDAILRGTGVDWLASAPYGFQTPAQLGAAAGSDVGGGSARVEATWGVSQPPGSGGLQPTPEQLEILQALSLIIGPRRPVLEAVARRALPDPTALRIGGKPATMADFRELVADILEGRAAVSGAEARP